MQYMKMGTVSRRPSKWRRQLELDEEANRREMIQNIKYFAVLTAGMLLSSICWVLALAI